MGLTEDSATRATATACATAGPAAPRHGALGAPLLQQSLVHFRRPLLARHHRKGRRLFGILIVRLEAFQPLNVLPAFPRQRLRKRGNPRKESYPGWTSMGLTEDSAFPGTPLWDFQTVSVFRLNP